ncbi:Clp protease N-terminal domain-containing protein [Actinoplanes sp. NPDC049265]|uniref:Clp protease N-terminal domain-containing protein n=1 Tax=Actinoplanes sp. NPDC049265 TaxID=3363902 RepID=UPI00371EF94F
MFERFTHAAREAVVGAQHEARELGQAPIGTQHVLLSLLADRDSALARALAADGVDHAFVRAEIVRRVPADAAPDNAAVADRDAEDREALKAIGIDLDKVRKAIEESFGPGALHLPRSTTPKRRGLFGRFYASGHIPFTPRNKKVLELSLREAIRLKHDHIAPEHIALGMIREGEGLAVQILTERGVDLVRLRETLTRSLSFQIPGA